MAGSQPLGAYGDQPSDALEHEACRGCEARFRHHATAGSRCRHSATPDTPAAACAIGIHS
jgi:hypothetical protein